MTALSIPELHPDLQSFLQQIILHKHFRLHTQQEWAQTIRPRIRARVVEICEVATSLGEKFGPRDPNLCLPDAISSSKDRIIDGIDTKFAHYPPFTIFRVAELLLLPESQGFRLNNNVQIFKYFNALQKLFTVSSTTNDFPIPVVSPPKAKVHAKADTPENMPENVALIKIPWLESSPKSKEQSSLDSPKSEQEENGDADTTIDSSPISSYPEEYEGISHKRQRLNGSLDVNRRMTGSSSPLSEEYSSLLHSQESVCPS